MYIIEMHRENSAHSQIVLEKGDDKKPYDEFSKYRLIVNHSGDNDAAHCKWCAIVRRAELMRERKKESCSGTVSLRS